MGISGAPDYSWGLEDTYWNLDPVPPQQGLPLPSCCLRDGLSNKTFCKGEGYPLHIYSKVSLAKCKYLYGEFGLRGFHTLKTASVIRLSRIPSLSAYLLCPLLSGRVWEGASTVIVLLGRLPSVYGYPFLCVQGRLGSGAAMHKTQSPRVCSSKRMRVMIHTHQAQAQWAFSEGLQKGSSQD